MPDNRSTGGPERKPGVLKRLLGSSDLDVPLELLDDILLELEEKLSPFQSGTATTFDRARIHLVAAEESRRLLLRDYFVTNRDTLVNPALRQRLADARLEHFADLPIVFEVISELPEEIAAELSARKRARIARKNFYIRFEKTGSVENSTSVKKRAQLRLVRGEAIGGEERFSLSPSNITNIGRTAEVTGPNRQTLRRNQVAFEDNKANAGVSRTHAHVRFNTDRGRYQIRDDGSTYGTQIIRSGTSRPINVRRTYRDLHDGDEVILGSVVTLLFETTAATA